MGPRAILKVVMNRKAQITVKRIELQTVSPHAVTLLSVKQMQVGKRK